MGAGFVVETQEIASLESRLKAQQERSADVVSKLRREFEQRVAELEAKVAFVLRVASLASSEASATTASGIVHAPTASVASGFVTSPIHGTRDTVQVPSSSTPVPSGGSAFSEGQYGGVGPSRVNGICAALAAPTAMTPASVPVAMPPAVTPAPAPVPQHPPSTPGVCPRTVTVKIYSSVPSFANNMCYVLASGLTRTTTDYSSSGTVFGCPKHHGCAETKPGYVHFWQQRNFDRSFSCKQGVRKNCLPAVCASRL